MTMPPRNPWFLRPRGEVKDDPSVALTASTRQTLTVTNRVRTTTSLPSPPGGQPAAEQSIHTIDSCLDENDTNVTYNTTIHSSHLYHPYVDTQSVDTRTEHHVEEDLHSLSVATSIASSHAFTSHSRSATWGGEVERQVHHDHDKRSDIYNDDTYDDDSDECTASSSSNNSENNTSDDLETVEDPMKRRHTTKSKKKVTASSTGTSTKHRNEDESLNESSSFIFKGGKNRTLCVAIVGIAALCLLVGGMSYVIIHKNQQLFTNSNDKAILDEDKWADFNGYAKVTNKYRLIQTYDHDPKSFSQGLQWHNNRIVESIGHYGQSLVRVWDPTAPNIEDSIDKERQMDDKYFAEGLCWYQDVDGNDRYIQLTWREQTAFVYDTDLNVLHSFQYSTKTTEGWGITFDPREKLFYVSDGSDYIFVWDLQFQEVRRFRVSLMLENGSQGSPYLKLLNELEWDPNDQTLLANVWFQNAIVRIHPQSGQVLQAYDLSTLYMNRDPSADVLNGIAHYQGNQWWITGKLWPNIYLVEFLE